MAYMFSRPAFVNTNTDIDLLLRYDKLLQVEYRQTPKSLPI